MERSHFFLFPFVHGMKFYQLLYCFLSFYLEGVYDTHTGKHKYACTSTQETWSLGFQRKDIYMFIVMQYVSLSQSLKFFPVFESLFRHMSHQILQGKMEGSVILGNVLNVPFHEALFLNKCRNWRLQTAVLLTNLRGNRY